MLRLNQRVLNVIKREFCLPSSVHIATKYRRLDKFALLDGALHFLDRDEVIMYAIFLARARFARGMGHAKMCKKLISFFLLMSLLSNLPEAERIGELLEQLLQQCALARARRATDNERTRSLLYHLSVKA